MMLKATDSFPMNFGFSGKGNASDPGGLKENKGIGHPPTDLLPPQRGRPTLVPRPMRGREESEGTGSTPGAEPGKNTISKPGNG